MNQPCENGCNGCDECTDFEEPRQKQPQPKPHHKGEIMSVQEEALYQSAKDYAGEKASISYVQRKCRCSYNDAERMLERMVKEGVLETYNGRKAAASTQPAVAAPLTPEQPGAVYAELPEPYSNIYPMNEEGLHGICFTPKFQPGHGRPNHQPVFTADHLRDFADRTHAIRAASHGQAPAQPAEVRGCEMLMSDGEWCQYPLHRYEEAKASGHHVRKLYALTDASAGPTPTPQAAQQAPEYVGNGMFNGETIQKAAEHWANWCDRRMLDGLSEFLRVVAAQQAPAGAAPVPEAPKLYTQADLDAAVAAEREACALLCSALADRCVKAQKGPADAPPNVMLRQIAVLGAAQCEHEIRNRSTK